MPQSNVFDFTPEDLEVILNNPTAKAYYDRACTAHQIMAQNLSNVTMILFLATNEQPKATNDDDWTVARPDQILPTSQL